MRVMELSSSPPSQVVVDSPNHAGPSPASQADKFAAVKLILGRSHQSDLKHELGLEDTREFARLMREPLQSMEQEWRSNGSPTDMENFKYITEGRARDPIPVHIMSELLADPAGPTESDFDAGHDGMTALHFLNKEISSAARLQLHHVALRLYTSSSYRFFNKPMRDGTKPHPIRVTMYVLDETLKKIRTVEARFHPERYNQTKVLWRGMRDRDLDLGTGLAPMSTSENKFGAESFATGNQRGLVFRCNSRGNSKGVCIDFLSLFPNEVEYL